MTHQIKFNRDEAGRIVSVVVDGNEEPLNQESLAELVLILAQEIEEIKPSVS